MELGRALLERLEGDVVLSPYSVQRALDVLRAGASGETRAALEDVLGPPAPELSAPGLTLAQAAWLAEGYTPGPALTLHTGPLDAAVVNAWASERTRGMIPRIVDGFGREEILALTDAAHLDAAWTTPFAPAAPRGFEGAGEVAMMRVRGTFEYVPGQAVRLPYGDGELRFSAVLGESYPETLAWSRGEGTVELPPFTASSLNRLTAPLAALGLGPAFVVGGDLEALVEGPGPKGLSSVEQRARVEVDARGTRAAAVTIARMRTVSLRAEPFHLTFDRPFTWAVEHAATGTLLFLGRVRHPSERSL